MKHLILVTLLAACGGAKPAPTTPITDPVPMTETPPPVAPSEPAQPDPAQVKKADLLAAERTAYEKARPVFEQYCAGCHMTGRRGAGPKSLEHFDMTTYPFGGHHAMELAKEIREVLAIGGGKPTMPKNNPGAVKGAELALIAAWADAFDASHAGGAHEGHTGAGEHKH
ncbi:MAG: hypothetical protein H0T79_11550 [Deltaproteobacteria bacterium]|nr:hypothetical protein [Deltaproteobacteria bacterium]